MKLSENIRYYREKLGLTQERLAEKLSISAQAVSKWERGEGMPDCETLTRLADIYDVSLDRLFGRDCASLDDTAHVLEAYLKPFSQEDRLVKLRELAYLCERIAVGAYASHGSGEAGQSREGDIHSVSNETERGFSFASNRPELQFYSVFIEPESGWRDILKAEDFREFFELMAQDKLLDTLLALYTKPNGIVFDESYAAREFGLDDPRPVLEGLTRLSILYRESVNIDGIDRRIYHFRAKCGIIALLSILNEFLLHNRHFDLQSCSRRTPYLR